MLNSLLSSDLDDPPFAIGAILGRSSKETNVISSLWRAINSIFAEKKATGSINAVASANNSIECVSILSVFSRRKSHILILTL